MKTIKDLKPTEKEKEKESGLVKKIKSKIKKISGKNAVLVGSVAKKTCLSGDKDLDIFILFDKNVPREKLEKEGLEIGKKVCESLGEEAEVHYAEHPYTKTSAEGYDIDLVPCYKIEKGEKIISAVDRSPLHTEYVKNNLENPNQTRLLKQFLKEIDAYGAKISSEGFSGYLAELLTIKYGSFKKVLENAANWNKREVIDLENHRKSEELKKEFKDNLIVMDPVDKRRNVAAAVSKENYAKFILMARQYLKNDEIPEKTGIEKNRGKIYVLNWDIEKEIPEVLWGQLRRFKKKLVKSLERHEFNVLDSLSWTDSEEKAQIIIELEVWDLPEVNDHEGPPIYDRKHMKQFLQKYDKVMFKGEKVVTERKRRFTKAIQIIEKLLKEVPSHLAEYNPKILEDKKALKTEVGQKYSKKLWRIK